MGFKCFQRKKAPKYTDEQIQLVKRHARWMHDHYRTKLFVVDDEKYFGLTGPATESYYTRHNESVPDEVKYKQKAKYEKKLLVYLAISERGMSQLFIAESGLAINQDTYLEHCLQGVLLPFLEAKHADGDYVFWPDKASSHYARKVVDFLNESGIPFVPKEHNPTNLPQCRPIEDLWGALATLVYENGWEAKNLQQLKRRVKFCFKKLDQDAVRRSCASIRKKLRLVYEKGPFAAVH